MKQFVSKFLIFILIFLLLLFLRLYLSFFGFGHLIKLLKKQRRNMLHVNKINYVKKSIEILSSKIPKTTCLLKAAALKIVFSDTNNLHVIIGIRIEKDIAFESHAWINYCDKVILNNNLKISSYKIIYTI